MASDVNIKNRKATHEYQLLDKYTAGLILLGSEIKSIRNSQANINDAFCLFIGDELIVRGMHIDEYKQASISNHETKRDRKLLLSNRELNKIRDLMKDKGLTIICLRLFISESGYAKLDIAVGKGKKLYDKRQDIKKKDTKREIDRALKR